MWLFSVFFLVDDSKLTCLGRGQNETFVPRLTAAAKQQICYSNWTQTPPPLLSSVDCRVDSGPNARFKSQVKPVASVGLFKEAEPSSFPEPNKEVLVKHVVFSIQVWLFLLRFCPLFSADSALDWSRTLWWFWFWLAWIFSHIQLSNFTPVQLKTWWNSQIQPTSENTNRDAGQKLILQIGSEATRVLWDIRTSCRGRSQRRSDTLWPGLRRDSAQLGSFRPLL